MGKEDLFDAAGKDIAQVLSNVQEKLKLFGGSDQAISTHVLHDVATELLLAGMAIESWLHTIGYVMSAKVAPVAEGADKS